MAGAATYRVGSGDVAQSPQRDRPRSRLLPPRPRWALRSIDLGHQLDVFLVFAAAAVVGNRLFLIATGYPQLGNDTLHISHALWGAFMMMLAIVGGVSFLAPATRIRMAMLGGAGFGWFIDELGKFITRDVNYFFKPTFALIYVIFIGMFLSFRLLRRHRFTGDEAVLNALEALKAAQIGQLRAGHRRHVLSLLKQTNVTGPLADHVQALLQGTTVQSEYAEHWPSRVAKRLRRLYIAWTEQSSFPIVVDSVFVCLALASLGAAVWIWLRGNGGFVQEAAVGSAIAAGVMTLVGVTQLPSSTIRAYEWFDIGLLVTIFVVQIFVFAEEQLAGAVGVGIASVAWTMLNSALREEREHNGMPAPR